jgi:hypothetical protein
MNSHDAFVYLLLVIHEFIMSFDFLIGVIDGFFWLVIESSLVSFGW